MERAGAVFRIPVRERNISGPSVGAALRTTRGHRLRPPKLVRARASLSFRASASETPRRYRESTAARGFGGWERCAGTEPDGDCWRYKSWPGRPPIPLELRRLILTARTASPPLTAWQCGDCGAFRPLDSQRANVTCLSALSTSRVFTSCVTTRYPLTTNAGGSRCDRTNAGDPVGQSFQPSRSARA
jgi:hypothetical protein